MPEPTLAPMQPLTLRLLPPSPPPSALPPFLTSEGNLFLWGNALLTLKRLGSIMKLQSVNKKRGQQEYQKYYEGLGSNKENVNLVS